MKVKPTIREPRAIVRWFIIEPSGTIVGYSCAYLKRDCIRDFLANIWAASSDWPNYEARGYRCLKCSIAPL